MISAPNRQLGYVNSDMLDAESILLAALLYQPELAEKYVHQISMEMFQSNGSPVRTALTRRALEQIREHGKCSPALVGEAVFNDGEHSKQHIAEVMDDLLQWTAFTASSEWQTVRSIYLLNERVNRLAIQNDLQTIAELADGKTFRNDEILDEIERFTTRIRCKSIVKLTTLADTLASDLSEEHGEAIRTGIDWFDKAMPNGSLHVGDKAFFAAPPGLGKTALALEVSIAVAIENKEANVLFAMGEMSERQIRNRALCSLSSLPMNILRRPWGELTPLQEQSKRTAIEVIRDIGDRFHFVKAPLTPAIIENGIVATDARFVVIDYLQLCRLERSTTSRRDEIDGVIRELQRITQTREVALFVISDMPKGPEKGRDIFSAFKESSEIPYAADLAYVGELLTETPEGADPYDLPDEVEINWRCLKSRNGQPKSIRTQFLRYCQQFREAR